MARSDVGRILETLDLWYTAKAEYDKAAETCDRDPDYFLSYENEAVVRAERAFGHALEEFVDDRIVEAQGEYDGD